MNKYHVELRVRTTYNYYAFVKEIIAPTEEMAGLKAQFQTWKIQFHELKLHDVEVHKIEKIKHYHKF